MRWIFLKARNGSASASGTGFGPWRSYDVGIQAMANMLYAKLELDALIRSVAVNASRPVSMLLGAGASVSSGMPSAERCIWEWKQDIFGTNNPALRESVGEISLPATKTRIQEWLDRRGRYPKLGAADEYSLYAEACFPTARDRKSFFQSYVRAAISFLG